MTIARRQQVSLDHTPYYHCTTRCVRRAFLCGNDRYSGKNFDHRRQWMEDRLVLLSEIFAIDLLAYAVMSNHYHVVVRIDSEAASVWSDEGVIERWSKIYSVPEQGVSDATVALWRRRLSDLSWYMRCLNEKFARLANREDRCKGRFWEGRFKSQALLDETALLKCMAYVDLNPIRAKIARTPETSAHTSICARIQSRTQHLLPMADQCVNNKPCIPIHYREYLELVDWTGRTLWAGKRGSIPAHLRPILQRAGLTSDDWIAEMTHYGRWYYRAVGSLAATQLYCQHLGQRWLKGALAGG